MKSATETGRFISKIFVAMRVTAQAMRLGSGDGRDAGTVASLRLGSTDNVLLGLCLIETTIDPLRACRWKLRDSTH